MRRMRRGGLPAEARLRTKRDHTYVTSGLPRPPPQKVTEKHINLIILTDGI